MNAKIRELIEGNDICVLATVAGAVPHCSLMSYAPSENGREIYMVTHKNTKKFRNLENNPRVSLLIDSRETDRGDQRPLARALTVTGVCEEVTDETKHGEIRRHILARHPHLKDFVTDSQARLIAVRIQSLQLLSGVDDAYFEEAD